MFLLSKPAVPSSTASLLTLTALVFVCGVAAGAMLMPQVAGQGAAVASTPPAAAPSAMPSTLRAGHPATVLRVIDGDTFEARVAVWPGMEITTKVRLRGIDAPEINARCADEYRRAIVARDTLTKMLAEGDVGIWRVGQDKYGGRVDADVSTRGTKDVSAQLLAAGAARRYDGGRRQSWCD